MDVALSFMQTWKGKVSVYASSKCALEASSWFRGHTLCWFKQRGFCMFGKATVAVGWRPREAPEWILEGCRVHTPLSPEHATPL